MLQQWIKDHRKAEEDRRRLEIQADEWTRLGRGSGALLDLIELAEAERWLSTLDAKELGYTQSLADFIIASKKAVQESERLEKERQQKEETLKQNNLDRERQAQKAERLRNVAIVSSIVVTILIGIIAWWQQQMLENRNMLYSDSPVANLKLVSKLSQLSQEAKQLSQQGVKEEDRAIDYYSRILNQAKKIQKDSRASPQEQTTIKEILNEVEPALVNLIKSKRIVDTLQKQLANGLFGGRQGEIEGRDTKYEDLEKQFTDALQTTYKILMIDTGADANRNGNLDSTDEVEAIPCDILKEVETAWKNSTQARCSFSGKNGDLSPCQNELKGQNLTVTLFSIESRSLFRERLKACKIPTSN
jgi:hypothetical protein